MLFRWPIAFFCTAFLSEISFAQQYPTIIGSWFEEEHGVGDCTSHWGVKIEPMSLQAGETMCEFRSVKREGWTVTWQGDCFESGETLPNMKVTATEKNGRLTLSFSEGGIIQGLRRCPKQSAIYQMPEGDVPRKAPLPEGKVETLYYGSRAGMKVTVVSKTGIASREPKC